MSDTPASGIAQAPPARAAGAHFPRRPEPVATIAIAKSKRVEIVLGTHCKASFVDIRAATKSGPLWFPSSDGFVVPLAKLSSLIAALAAAERQARERSLLVGDGTTD